MKNYDFDWQSNEFMAYCRSTQLRERTMYSYEQTLRLFKRWLCDELKIYSVDKVTENMIRKSFVYNSDYLPTAISSNAWIWVLFIAAYAMLPSVLHGSGIKEDLPFLKDFPEVTFSEVLSTYIATLIIPTAPMCLVLLFVHPVVSLLALIFLPVAFTYAHLKDKPLREKEEAERSRIQSKLFAMQFAESFRRGENPITNAPQVDTDRLRNDLMNHYGTAMHNGFPMAQADLVHVQGASDAELIAEAKKSGFDLNKYTR